MSRCDFSHRINREFLSSFVALTPIFISSKWFRNYTFQKQKMTNAVWVQQEDVCYWPSESDRGTNLLAFANYGRCLCQINNKLLCFNLAIRIHVWLKRAFGNIGFFNCLLNQKPLLKTSCIGLQVADTQFSTNPCTKSIQRLIGTVCIEKLELQQFQWDFASVCGGDCCRQRYHKKFEFFALVLLLLCSCYCRWKS